MKKTATDRTRKTAARRKPKSPGKRRARTSTFSGLLGVAQAERLRLHLLAEFERGDDVQLDLARVASMDVFTLQVLYSAHKTLAAAGRRLLLRNAAPAVAELAEAAALGHLLKV